MYRVPHASFEKEMKVNGSNVSSGITSEKKIVSIRLTSVAN